MVWCQHCYPLSNGQVEVTTGAPVAAKATRSYYGRIRPANGGAWRAPSVQLAGPLLQPDPATAMAIASRTTAVGTEAHATTLVPDAVDATVTEQGDDQWTHRNSTND